MVKLNKFTILLKDGTKYDNVVDIKEHSNTLSFRLFRNSKLVVVGLFSVKNIRPKFIYCSCGKRIYNLKYNKCSNCLVEDALGDVK